MGLTRPTAAQINSNVEVITDPLSVLNNKGTTNNIDVGLLMNRNGGGVSNVALFWQESNLSFVTAYTSSNGAIATSNVVVTSYADLTLGNINITGNIVNNANVNGSLSLGGALVAGGSPGAIGQYLQSTGTGTQWVTGTSAQVTQLNQGGTNVVATSGYVNVAVLSGNVMSFGYALIYSLAYLNIGANLSAQSAAFGAVTTANLIATSGVYSTGQYTAAVSTGIVVDYIAGVGRISGGTNDRLSFYTSGPGNLFLGGFDQYGNLNITGNVLATSFIGNGNLLTSLPGYAYSNVNLAAYLGSVSTVNVGGNLRVQGNLTVIGNITSQSVEYINVTEYANSIQAGNISAVIIGNTGATVQGTVGQFYSNVIGGLAQFAAINSTIIGNATAASGSFTTLYANVNANSNLVPLSTLVVTGAIGATGNIVSNSSFILGNAAGGYGARTFFNSVTNSIDTVFG